MFLLDHVVCNEAVKKLLEKNRLRCEHSWSLLPRVLHVLIASHLYTFELDITELVCRGWQTNLRNAPGHFIYLCKQPRTSLVNIEDTIIRSSTSLKPTRALIKKKCESESARTTTITKTAANKNKKATLKNTQVSKRRRLDYKRSDDSTPISSSSSSSSSSNSNSRKNSNKKDKCEKEEKDTHAINEGDDNSNVSECNKDDSKKQDEKEEILKVKEEEEEEDENIISVQKDSDIERGFKPTTLPSTKAPNRVCSKLFQHTLLKRPLLSLFFCSTRLSDEDKVSRYISRQYPQACRDHQHEKKDVFTPPSSEQLKLMRSNISTLLNEKLKDMAQCNKILSTPFVSESEMSSSSSSSLSFSSSSSSSSLKKEIDKEEEEEDENKYVDKKRTRKKEKKDDDSDDDEACTSDETYDIGERKCERKDKKQNKTQQQQQQQQQITVTNEKWEKARLQSANSIQFIDMSCTLLNCSCYLSVIHLMCVRGTSAGPLSCTSAQENECVFTVLAPWLRCMRIQRYPIQKHSRRLRNNNDNNNNNNTIACPFPELRHLHISSLRTVNMHPLHTIMPNLVLLETHNRPPYAHIPERYTLQAHTSSLSLLPFGLRTLHFNSPVCFECQDKHSVNVNVFKYLQELRYQLSYYKKNIDDTQKEIKAHHLQTSVENTCTIEVKCKTCKKNAVNETYIKKKNCGYERTRESSGQH